MITANALICGKKIQLIVIKIMSFGYNRLDSIDAAELLRDVAQSIQNDAQESR
ncbi:hypothetical protein [Symbiopectobacterium sp. RP]|uniref:hypothetical protein n=1 Tax=Symbiopectobacterium sp. RP TaxID=3248553 RepID=UPI003D2662FD